MVNQTKFDGRARLYRLRKNSESHHKPYPLDGCPMFPGFPVEVLGVGALHADFLNEIRTRGYVQGCVTGNPVAPAYVGRI
jgi:hypothetical protein